jgi:hypothetical protein
VNLKDKIKAVEQKPVLKALQVPEWDNLTVYLRVMSLKELVSFKTEINNIDSGELGNIDSIVDILCYFICDEEGKPVFNVKDDKDFLMEYSPQFLLRLYREYFNFSELVRDAEKN